MLWTWKERLKFFGFMTFIGMLVRRIIKGHWTEYIDRIGTSLSEATTETEITGSPYSPLASGRLKEVILTVCGSAATALWNSGYVRIASVAFGGVDLYIPFSGQGIKTAPAVNPNAIVRIPVDVAVQTGVVLKAYVKHETADTPVTFECQVFGRFQG